MFYSYLSRNQTANATCDVLWTQLPYPMWRVVFIAASTLFSFFGSIQNVIFLTMVAKGLLPLTQINVIFVCMSATDLLVSLLVAPIHVLQMGIHSAFFPCRLDKARVLLSAMVLSLMSYLVCFLGYHRLRHVKQPHDFNFDTSYFVMFLLFQLFLAFIVPLILSLIHI